MCGCGTDKHGAKVESYEIDSQAVGRELPQRLVLPEERSDALLVFLHGRNGDEDSNLQEELYAALADLGKDAPAVVFPDGGEDSYWHDRSTGAWGRYVIDEVIPRAIEESDADPRRVAIGGISMGGFGAYDLARLYPDRFCAVGGHSPAVWTEGGQTAPGAFDDAEDFARHDVIALARARGRAAWGRAELWLDGGTTDPFRRADEALAAALGIRMRHWTGGHEHAYWQRHYDAYLRFYATALARC